MATLYSSDIPKTERFSAKTDHSLIEAVQNRFKLLKTLTDLNHPVIRAGERAFTELLRRYSRWLWKEVRRFTGLDLNDAYSYALQGFERAINKFDLHCDCALVSFASVVVRRAIQRLLQREQRHREKVAMAAEVAPLFHEDAFVDPYGEEQREQQIEALHSEVKQLEVSRQKIVEMRQSGLKFTEIGAFFSKTADAIRMIYRRAIAHLKKHLQPQPPLSFDTAPFAAAQDPQGPQGPQGPQEPQTAEIEPLTALASDPIPTTGWMGRLWSRFCKSVRFSNSGAISDSSTPIVSPDALDGSVDAPQRSSPVHDPSSPRSSPCYPLPLDETISPPGFQSNVRKIGRYMACRAEPSPFMLSSRLDS
jgi:RNA polymerase sigma factor (sigma-70 family)